VKPLLGDSVGRGPARGISPSVLGVSALALAVISVFLWTDSTSRGEVISVDRGSDLVSAGPESPSADVQEGHQERSLVPGGKEEDPTVGSNGLQGPLHPDLRVASPADVKATLSVALIQLRWREDRVSGLSDQDRSSLIVQAEFESEMRSLVLLQGVVRSLQAGRAYLQLQVDPSGAKDYFGDNWPYMKFSSIAEVPGQGQVKVIVPAADVDEVKAANAAGKAAIDRLAREVAAYYGTLSREEIQSLRESRKLNLRGIEIPQSIHEFVAWRLKWAEDGLSVRFIQR